MLTLEDKYISKHLEAEFELGIQNVIDYKPDEFGWVLLDAKESFQFSANIGIPVNHICWCNHKYIALGTNGYIAISTDTATWSTINTTANVALNDIIFFNDIYVIAGASGIILYSNDNCATWLSVASGYTGNMNAAIAGNGFGLVVGDNCAILKSTNGTTWTAVTGGNPDHIYSIAFANDTYIASSIGSVYIGNVDATSWRRVVVTGASRLVSIEFGNNVFLTVDQNGKTFKSTDNGTTWTTTKVTGLTTTMGMIFNGTDFVAYGNAGAYAVSHTGATWTKTQTALTSDINSMLYHDLTYILVKSDHDLYLYSAGLAYDLNTLKTPGNFVAVNYLNGPKDPKAYHPFSISVASITSGGSSFIRQYSQINNDIWYRDYISNTFTPWGIASKSEPIYINPIEPTGTADKRPSVWLKQYDHASSPNTLAYGMNVLNRVDNTYHEIYQGTYVGNDDFDPTTAIRNVDFYAYIRNLLNQKMPYIDSNATLVSMKIINGNCDIIDVYDIKGTDRMNLADIGYASLKCTHSTNPYSNKIAYLYLDANDNLNQTLVVDYGTSPIGNLIVTSPTDTLDLIIAIDQVKNTSVLTYMKVIGAGVNTFTRALNNPIQYITNVGNFIYILTSKELLITNDCEHFITVPHSIDYDITGFNQSNSKYIVYGKDKVANATGKYNLKVSTCYIDASVKTKTPAWTTTIIGEVGGPGGITWTNRLIKNNSDLQYVIYGNNSFISVGENGAIQTSPDGITWSKINSDTRTDFCGIAYGNGLYVAIGKGDFGSIYTSPDGITWTWRSRDITIDRIRSITYGNRLFVAVGVNDRIGTIITSTDGITWTSRTSGTTNTLRGITYANGLFVAVGDNGTILTSTDTITWTNRTSSGTTEILTSITYGNGLYVAVGDNGTILTSTDGITWTKRTSGTSNSFTSITYGNGLYVAVGDSGTILTSTDGITWTIRTSGTIESLYSIAYGNGMYVVIGYNYSEFYSTMLTSPDTISSGDIIANGKSIYFNTDAHYGYLCKNMDESTPTFIQSFYIKMAAGEATSTQGFITYEDGIFFRDPGIERSSLDKFKYQYSADLDIENCKSSIVEIRNPMINNARHFFVNNQFIVTSVNSGVSIYMSIHRKYVASMDLMNGHFNDTNIHLTEAEYTALNLKINPTQLDASIATKKANTEAEIDTSVNAELLTTDLSTQFNAAKTDFNNHAALREAGMSDANAATHPNNANDIANWERLSPIDHTHNVDGKVAIDASKVVSGVIDIARVPDEILQRVVTVADNAARFALTKAQVQNGDVVHVINGASLDFWFRVFDDTKLNVEDGYIDFTQNPAMKISYTDITGTPTTIAGYGITNAYTKATVINKRDAVITASTTYGNTKLDTFDKTYCGGIDAKLTNNRNKINDQSSRLETIYNTMILTTNKNAPTIQNTNNDKIKKTKSDITGIAENLNAIDTWL